MDLKEGPLCRATEVGRQGCGGDSHSLPRGKINFNYFSHAAWLFIIYNLVILPFTGVALGNNPELNPFLPYAGNKNGQYSNFLITFSIILYTNFTSLKYIIREIKSTDKAKPLLISFHYSKFLQSRAGYVEANAIPIYFNGNSGFSDCG